MDDIKSSSLSELWKDNVYNNKIKKKILNIEKAILTGGSIAIHNEKYIYYEEILHKDKNLKLNLIKNCINDSNAPVMPSLRLVMKEKDYDEPIRDRDKNWSLDSQRSVINQKGSELISPSSTLKLGEYHSIYRTSKLFWAAEYHQYFRETRMWRKAQIISETNCIVDVFGIGFSGRIFSEGSSAPKFLVIEVYSIWNSQKYASILSMLELRILLGEKSELLQPGRKFDLIEAIVRSLYFKYTVTIPRSDKYITKGVDVGRIDNNDVKDDDNTTISIGPTCRDEILTETSFPEVQTVIHLEKLQQMPKGYPTTIEQMIRVPPLTPEDISDPLPIVTQELMLGMERRGTGIKDRIFETKLRYKRIEEEEQRMRLARLAIIKRKRDRVAVILVRTGLRFAFVAAYHQLLRPTTITIKGMAADEAVNMQMFIGLTVIQSLLNISHSSLKWTKDEIASYTSRALRFIKLSLLDGNKVSLRLRELSGSEAEFVKKKSLSNLIQTIQRRKEHCKVICLWNTIVKENYDSTTSLIKINNGENEMKEDSVRSNDDQCLLSPYQYEKHSWVSLGINGRNRINYGKLLGIILKPFQEIDRGLRLTSRCTRVGRIFCIYKLYAHTQVGFRGIVPEWPPSEIIPVNEEIVIEGENKSEVMIDSDDDDNFVLPSNGDNLSDDNEEPVNEKAIGNIVDIYNDAYASIATGLILELSIYIPYGGQLGERLINGGTKYKLRFGKSELDTLVPVSMRPLIGTALRSLYHNFYKDATEEEVTEAENAWDIIGMEIMSRSRWDLKDSLDIFKLSEIKNLKQCGKTDMIQEKLNFDEKLKYVKSLTQKFALLSHEIEEFVLPLPVVVTDEITTKLPSPSNDPEIQFSDDENDVKPDEIQSQDVPSKIEEVKEQQIIPVKNTDTSIENQNNNNNLLIKPTYLTLTWSSLIYRKVMKIKSAVLSRGDFVLLQVEVWQQNDLIGIVCYDRLKNDIYFAQQSDTSLMSSQIHNYRFMNENERSLQIYFVLSAQLTYTEYICKNDISHGKVTFAAVEIESAAIELSNVVESDYSSNTETMLAAAQDKAKSRLKRK